MMKKEELINYSHNYINSCDICWDPSDTCSKCWECYNCHYSDSCVYPDKEK
jgi:hypothetical protein